MDLLKTQLILKGVMSIEEWEEMKEHIQFDFIADNYFTELKEIEIRNERMNQVNVMDPYVGKYFSVDYMRRQVLKQTEQEIKEIDKQINSEREAGIIVDPEECRNGSRYGCWRCRCLQTHVAQGTAIRTRTSGLQEGEF